MAKLKITIDLETTEEYDEAVDQHKLLRVKVRAETPADQLGQQIAAMVSGLRYVENGSVTVEVSKLIGGHHTSRSGIISILPAIASDGTPGKSSR